MLNSPRTLIPKREVHIIGDGCAALSFAARAGELPLHQLTIIQPDGAPAQKEHVWGFWRVDGLDNAAELARKGWNFWSIISAKGKVVLSSDTHTYYALSRKKWEKNCIQLARENGVKFINQANLVVSPDAQILDSRPPIVSVNQMFQYFIGWEIKAKPGSFNAENAILMDFRCDQSRGIHFIYTLPFSSSKALVESTMFSKKREPDSFFETAIKTYVNRHFGVDDFTIERVEKGGIPLGRLPSVKSENIGIGGNGNAIRPSSGYAFAFIQKQILATIQNAKGKNKNSTNPLVIKCPHKLVDLWMDEVFVNVLKLRPDIAPELFLKMAKALDGDAFAQFLSGEAGWLVRLKVVLAMPKFIFIYALVLLIIKRSA
tara:strand:+ start:190 stop:1308 length:1119 start_codon:yes stop_codon:yes gene_type:complete